jgi:hypothetical protein
MDKQNIHNMFVNELLSTSENETVIKMKDYIYNTIKTPSIQEIFPNVIKCEDIKLSFVVGHAKTIIMN